MPIASGSCTQTDFRRSRKPAYSPTVCGKCTLCCNSFDRQHWIVADVNSRRILSCIHVRMSKSIRHSDNSLVINVHHWRNKREPDRTTDDTGTIRFPCTAPCLKRQSCIAKNSEKWGRLFTREVFWGKPVSKFTVRYRSRSIQLTWQTPPIQSFKVLSFFSSFLSSHFSIFQTLSYYNFIYNHAIRQSNMRKHD
jgi:hypothetical protein